MLGNLGNRFFIAYLLSASAALCENPNPVGLVTEAKGVQIRPSGQESFLIAYRGELLYPGDALSVKGGLLSLAFCPTRSSYSTTGNEVLVEKNRVLVNGKEQPSKRPVPFCELPAVPFAQQSRLAYDIAPASAPVKAGGEPAPSRPFSSDETAVLDPLEAALRADPHDLTTRLARAVTLERMFRPGAAAREYAMLSAEAPDAPWIATKKLSLSAASDRAMPHQPRLLAVVVGISHYARLEPERQLRYADQDAALFADYLATSRGRGDSRTAEVSLLLNEGANLAAIRNAIRATFAEAEEHDTVIFFVAGHGSVIESGPSAGAYILAHDSNPEDLKDSGLPMDDLEELTTGSLNPKQVQIYVDVCHSGFIGSLNNRKFNRFVTKLTSDARPTTEVFGLLASHPKEVSYECLNYRHGAFTYFLIRGLNTDEAADVKFHDITARSLSGYVEGQVKSATKQEQNPMDNGTLGGTAALAKLDLIGLSKEQAEAPNEQANAPEACQVSQGRQIAAPEPTSPAPASTDDPFTAAIQHGLILPHVPGSAFDMLGQMRGAVSVAAYLAARNRLLVALENAGQQIILEYLKGEAVDLQASDFEKGEQFFAAAALLSPDDAFIASRRLFCLGRALLFNANTYPAAIEALNDSIRLDPQGAYSYNALGIGLLQTANYQAAIAAFRDAILFAPYWLYARHNLALALTQTGECGEAMRTYQVAMALVPHYSYIPYDLGLLYERLNQPERARSAWRQSLALTPNMARAWNAIGLSYFLEGRLSRASDAYDEALRLAVRPTDRLAIRHDMALLLVKRGQPADAIHDWRLNLAEAPDDLPSLIGLSELLVASGNPGEALPYLSAIVKQRPDYTGARLRLAKTLLQVGKPSDAEAEVKKLLAATPDNADACELLADMRAQNISSAAGLGEAEELYQRALKQAISGEQRNRIRHKLKSLSS
jgi:tetratricopeptide (TPR) repeat protein